MFSWPALWAHMREMRGYIAFSTILFVAGIIVGSTNEQLEAFMDSQLAGLSGLAEMAESSSNPQLTFFLIIFFNNAIKSILVMYLGAAFAIVPIFFLLVNGMVLGYLFTGLTEQLGAAYVAELIVRGIVPHGILEIPAILVAGAYGLRFGVLSLQVVGNLFRRKQGIGAKYEQLAVRSVPLMVLLTIVLLVAAVIEATLSFWLIEGMQR